eukprot:scaffold1372_cov351-Pavlova_lutheri.AAC.19
MLSLVPLQRATHRSISRYCDVKKVEDASKLVPNPTSGARFHGNGSSELTGPKAARDSTIYVVGNAWDEDILM